MKKVIKVNGMCCHHCAEHVLEAIQSDSNVKKVKINLKKGEAKVIYDAEPDWEEISKAVKEAGYEIA